MPGDSFWDVWFFTTCSTLTTPRSISAPELQVSSTVSAVTATLYTLYTSHKTHKLVSLRATSPACKKYVYHWSGWGLEIFKSGSLQKYLKHEVQFFLIFWRKKNVGQKLLMCVHCQVWCTLTNPSVDGLLHTSLHPTGAYVAPGPQPIFRFFTIRKWQALVTRITLQLD